MVVYFIVHMMSCMKASYLDGMVLIGIQKVELISDVKDIEWGFKFHMNDVCAVGMENFKHLDEIVSKHKENESYYDSELQNVNGVTLLKEKKDSNQKFWIYTLKVDDRPSFYEYMKECNITVSQVHERNDKHSCVGSSKQSYQT